MECAEARVLVSRRLDDTVQAAERGGLKRHLATCGGCRAVARAFRAEQVALNDLWPAVAAPPGFTQRVSARLPPAFAREPVLLHGESARAWRGVGARRWLAAVAAFLAVTFLVGSGLGRPEAWASVGLFLRHVVLRESSSPSAEPPRTVPVRSLTLEQAQALVPWRIRQPTDLPPGYHLVGVEANEIHSFALGQTIILHYQQAGGTPGGELSLVELQAGSEAPEPVAPGSSRAVSIGNTSRTGLLIEGRLVEQSGQPVWERGALLRLVIEYDDLVVQLQADPRAGWDADGLVRVASSVR